MANVMGADLPSVLERTGGSAGRLKILHVLAPAQFGGLERVVHSLVTAQRRSGHEASVAAILDHDAPEHGILVDLQQRGVEVHELRVRRRAYRREISLMKELCARVTPDVVHTHGYRADVLHGWIARRIGVPSVTTVHGLTGGDWKNRIYEALQRRAFRRFGGVVAVSRPLRASLADHHVPEDRLHCIPNAWVGGVDFFDRTEARRRLGLDPEAVVVGYVGRLSEEKGPDVFVESVASMDTPALGVVIGDGPLREELERRARELGVEDRIRWCGVVPDVARLVRAFDVLTLSSRTEGTPMVLLEAMAAGVPVVATRVGGVPYAVSEAEAWLVAPERPDALARALDEALVDGDARAERSASARLRLDSEFGADGWLERYDRVYRESGAIAVEKPRT